MTFRILQQLSPALQQKLQGHLEDNVQPHLYGDVSNYARGRQRVWLPYEAPLSTARNWESGLADAKLWAWICATARKFDFEADVALASRGGGINRHRDASYAEFRALGINLGEATWYYEDIYKDFRWQAGAEERGEVEVYQLQGGEVFEFCCKNPHWVSDVAPDRWGINVWHVSGKERTRFNNIRSLEAL